MTSVPTASPAPLAAVGGLARPDLPTLPALAAPTALTPSPRAFAVPTADVSLPQAAAAPASAAAPARTAAAIPASRTAPAAATTRFSPRRGAAPSARTALERLAKKKEKMDKDLLDADFDGAAADKTDYDVDAFRVPDRGAPVDLTAHDPDAVTGFKRVKKRGNRGNKAAYKLKKADVKALQELQTRLYAEGKRSLLIVLQALDTGGKDGSIRHVLGPLNPQGVKVHSFKKPTQEEIDNGYLWRIEKALPRKGEIGVFNRSHYEDILVPTVLGTHPAATIEERYEQIRRFEERLAARGTTILKFYLHISKDEQKRRLQDRLDDPQKHWKFSKADLQSRARWGSYLDVYRHILGRTSSAVAPWYVIPANHKWFRNFLLARIIRRAMQDMDLRYPEPEDGLADVVIPD